MMKKKISIIGVPMDLGQTRRGVDMGPSAMRYAGVVERLGVTKVMEETIKYLSENTDGVHLSLDLDALDPNDAPGVGTPVMGGISYRESHLAMEMLAESKLITSAEFVEVNPILDDRNKTATAAVALIGSLFGEKLL